MNNPILTAEDITKEYKNGSNTLSVLKDVSLTIAQSSISMILGTSGAGKSTLLHILGGLDQPTRGTVTYDESNLYSISDRARTSIRNTDFGFVFQFYHLMPELNALENILMPAYVGRELGKKEKEWAKNLIDAVGLNARAHHYPSQLSGGEQQRIALARSLMMKPRILFSDEPTGNLDSKNSEVVINLLLELQKAYDFALVMVTHDQSLTSLGTSKYILDDGVLTQN